MKATKRMALFAAIAVMALGSARPSFAQVEKVAMRTSGLSCGDCAAVSEVYLRRLDGIDTVKISMSQEFIMLTLKPGAVLDSWAIRDALDRTEVGVLQIQIAARGQAKEEGGKKFFIAGKNKFVLVPGKVEVPLNTPVTVEGSLNDKPDPVELKPLTVTPLAK